MHRHVTVGDVGKALNPLQVEGVSQGGLLCTAPALVAAVADATAAVIRDLPPPPNLDVRLMHTKQPSSIMVDKITTMPRDNVRDRLGRITDAEVIRLNRELVVFLGLAE